MASDYGASHATSDLLVGLDQEFLSNNLAPAALKPLVDATSPTFEPAYGAALDSAVARILYQDQRFGRLDDSTYPPYAKTGVVAARAPSGLDEQAGIALARKLAEESAVPLKNDDRTLPFKRSKDSSIAVIGPTAALMPAASTNERSRGFGSRNTISPLDVLRQNAGTATVTYAPGIDRIGTVVPAEALRTSPGGPPGLTRTASDPTGAVIVTQVDAQLAGDQNDLVKGNTYTWTGYLDVPTGDTYRLWLQRPAGTVVGDPTGPNGGVNPGYRAGPFHRSLRHGLTERRRRRTEPQAGLDDPRQHLPRRADAQRSVSRPQRRRRRPSTDRGPAPDHHLLRAAGEGRDRADVPADVGRSAERHGRRRRRRRTRPTTVDLEH